MGYITHYVITDGKRYIGCDSDTKENIMNRYSLFITTGSGDEFDEWKFTVLAEDSRDFVMQCILETKKEFKCESPVDLMDLVCDMYGWKWEDFTPDMEIEM